MRRSVVLLVAIAITASLVHSRGVRAESAQVVRVAYLVQFGGCGDCHTPGHFFGKPDTSRLLGGSDVGFEVPDLGIFVGPNLTPDRDTGLGNWTKEEIITAMQTGVRPDGRMLAPIMPWGAYAGLAHSDADAIAEYLRSLPPVNHKVSGPIGLDERPAIFRMKILPPDDQGQRN